MSRRNSTASLQDYRTASTTPCDLHDPNHRPAFRRSSTGGAKSDSGVDFRYPRSMERGNASGRRSRSSGGGQEREHVTIAPIAPTILKAGDADGSEHGTLYMGGAPVLDLNSGNPRVRDTSSHPNASGDYPNGIGYGYGGYGFGEEVSAGRDDASRHFERGTDARELVYQSLNGNRYPWNEKDAIRFCMLNEYGMPSPPGSPGGPSGPAATYFSATASSSSDEAHFVPLQSLGSPRAKEESERAEFEYFDEVDRVADHGPSQRIMHNGRVTDLPASQTIEFPQEEEAVAVHRPVDSPEDAGANRKITRGESTSSSEDSIDERQPISELAIKQNPRIASLKTDGSSRQSMNSSIGSEYTSPASSTAPMPIFNSSFEPGPDTDPRRRPSLESPTLHTGFLSPPELSPRGRWLSNSPESIGSGASSYLDSGSRSTSESRSDSRGRSQTRNSSLTSSDTNEPERGRSRSRSTASGANSPMRETASPVSRSSMSGATAIGLGIGGSYGGHIGREIHDGRGTKLYRKTSEDNLGGHYDGRSSQSLRGRVRDGKRVSESLSPPMVSSLPADMNRKYAATSSPHSLNGERPTGSPISRKRSRGKGNSTQDGEAPVDVEENQCGTPELRSSLSGVAAGRLPSVAEDSSDLQSNGHRKLANASSSLSQPSATAEKGARPTTHAPATADGEDPSQGTETPVMRASNWEGTDAIPSSGTFSRNGE